MSEKKTLVIAAFPGCGKTFCTNDKVIQEKYTMLDSDSSHFSWIKDENGQNTKERNPDFPNNYIQHIKDNIGKVDIIFVSTHAQVRKALRENAIPYYLVYPVDDEGQVNKCMFVQRYRKRGSGPDFCQLMADNWSTFIGEMMVETWPTHVPLDGMLPTDDKNGCYITLKLLDNLFEGEKGNE